MPGNWITNRQVEIYMNARKLGKTQPVSAAQAGISVRSGILIIILVKTRGKKTGIGVREKIP